MFNKIIDLTVLTILTFAGLAACNKIVANAHEYNYTLEKKRKAYGKQIRAKQRAEKMEKEAREIDRTYYQELKCSNEGQLHYGWTKCKVIHKNKKKKKVKNYYFRHHNNDNHKHTR
jgi:hypothetical protein